MEPIADCEVCGTPTHEGDDHEFDPEGLIWVCRSCIDAERDRLEREFGWIGTGGERVGQRLDGGESHASAS